MLSITVQGEVFDEEKQMFTTLNKPVSLMLEHSLLSVSKWESIWKIPFFPAPEDQIGMTTDQYLSYIKCMTTNKGVPDEAYLLLNSNDYAYINKYIDEDQTATWFSENESREKGDRTATTSELLYYYMTAYQIPWEAEKWHLSRLFALIRICNIKNSPPNKMSKSEILNRNRALNEKRRKATGSKG